MLRQNGAGVTREAKLRGCCSNPSRLSENLAAVGTKRRRKSAELTKGLVLGTRYGSRGGKRSI